ncbi:MAG TPA: polysaccharide biosynthesis/export family protein [Opitutaceae bacterium]|nr:polysaccharide biosynthesis/export family protein [Opitutaceae bacterium]
MSRLSRSLRTAVAGAALASSLFGAGTLAGQTPPASAEAPGKADTKKNFIYRLTNTDRLRIVVFGEPDLATISRIDARGNVNLYLVGDVHVAGSTVNEAQKTIETAYRDGRFLRNPQVTISVEDYAPRTVTVDGQVKSPGPVSLPTESTLTVYQAIIRAGGFTDIAKGSAVTVTRLLPDGTKKVFTVDVDSLIKGRDRAKTEDDSLLLEPGDIIYVPERLI